MGGGGGAGLGEQAPRASPPWGGSSFWPYGKSPGWPWSFTRAPSWLATPTPSLVPGERQLSDPMLRALGERGGIVGTVLYNPFLVAGWRKGDPRPGLEAVARHMAHVAGLVGWERVGLGSDLDGGDPLPLGPARGPLAPREVPAPGGLSRGDGGECPGLAEGLAPLGPHPRVHPGEGDGLPHVG